MHKLYHQAEKLMLTDAPTVALDYPLAVRATNNRIGVAGLWIALLVFLGVRGISLLWRSRARARTVFADPT